jgi:hypothetical protein
LSKFEIHAENETHKERRNIDPVVLGALLVVMGWTMELAHVSLELDSGSIFDF